MIQKHIFFRGLKLCYVDNEKKSKLNLIFLHGNGYSGGCYHYYLRRLGKKYRVLSIDLINHGASESSFSFRSLSFYEEQVLAVIQQERLDNIVGIGHSMGGLILIGARHKKPEIFQLLIGFDPPFLNAFKIYYSRLFGNPLSQRAKKRKASFKSRKVLEYILKKSHLTKAWHPEIMKDYIDTCYKVKKEKLFLCCDPLAESKNFRSVSYKTIWQAQNADSLTYLILPQKTQLCSKRMAARVIGKHSKSKVIWKKKISHHFPFEEPEWTLTEIQKILKRA